MIDPLDDEGTLVPRVGSTFTGPPATPIRASQEKSNWCWAAVTQMIRRHVRLSEKEQCEIVATRLARPCCPEPDECNVKLEFSLIGTLLAENGVESTHKQFQLASNTFWEELHLKQPILLADIFDNGVDGHVRLALGAQLMSRGPHLIRVADPAEDKISSTSFEALQRSRWRQTWHGIETSHGES